MNVLVWILRVFVEPIFWSSLQWIWSFEDSFETETLPLQFYGYSSTSVLLWLYERLPHPVILTLLIIGTLASAGGLLLVSLCSFKLVWVLVRMFYTWTIIRLRRVLLVLVILLIRGLALLSGSLFRTCVRRIRAIPDIWNALNQIQQASAAATLTNRPEPSSRRNRTIPDLDASAFHPRRRRTRSSRLSEN